MIGTTLVNCWNQHHVAIMEIWLCISCKKKLFQMLKAVFVGTETAISVHLSQQKVLSSKLLENRFFRRSNPNEID